MNRHKQHLVTRLLVGLVSGSDLTAQQGKYLLQEWILMSSRMLLKLADKVKGNNIDIVNEESLYGDPHLHWLEYHSMSMWLQCRDNLNLETAIRAL